jgi:predicted peptidase
MTTTGFLDRSVCADEAGAAGAPRAYQVYVPRHYTPDRSWPLILFLHGAGEGGEDGLLQTEFQLGSAIRRHADLVPAIAVFPQQSPAGHWSGTDLGLALKSVELTCQDYRIDPRRLSLCGVSSGAIGAWALARHNPHRFARLLIVAGMVGPVSGIPPNSAVVPEHAADPHQWLAEQLSHLPIWIHHGDSDPLYPVEDARRIVANLRALGAPVRYSEFPGFGHNVWDGAFYSEAVLRWLVAPRRQP